MRAKEEIVKSGFFFFFFWLFSEFQIRKAGQFCFQISPKWDLIVDRSREDGHSREWMKSLARDAFAI